MKSLTTLELAKPSQMLRLGVESAGQSGLVRRKYKWKMVFLLAGRLPASSSVAR
jgi:hypothetical protein